MQIHTIFLLSMSPPQSLDIANNLCQYFLHIFSIQTISSNLNITLQSFNTIYTLLTNNIITIKCKLKLKQLFLIRSVNNNEQKMTKVYSKLGVFLLFL